MGRKPKDSPPKKRGRGRPTTYTHDLASRICAEMADGKSLRSVCKADDMPACSSVFLWIGKYPEFSEQYEKAVEQRAASIFEESLEIADDGTNDWMVREGKDGENLGWTLNGEHVQRSRLRVDTRKWFLSKMLPKRYGDRIEHVGEISTPVRFIIEGAPGVGTTAVTVKTSE